MRCNIIISIIKTSYSAFSLAINTTFKISAETTIKDNGNSIVQNISLSKLFTPKQQLTFFTDTSRK